TIMMRAAKQALRKKVKLDLKEMTLKEKTLQSANITQQVLDNKWYKSATRLSIYLSMKNEVQTYDILKHAIDSNKAVFIPKYVGDNMDMVRLHSMEDYEALPETKWFIKQPLDGDNTRENAIETGGLDLILVPGVAFTKAGGRMGHGKGYYDTYIEKISIVKKPKLVGLAFNVQMLDEIPLSEHDQPLDDVITYKC
uniref:5-formyltetrahydrofolate cyclo-ligase n=1 Tax=Ciona intestinalis TaxID=7719 RepID=F6YZ79_CIOIN